PPLFFTKIFLTILLILLFPSISHASIVIFQENFDSATPPSLPSGWAQVDVNGRARNWAKATNTVHPSGQPPKSSPNLVYFNSYYASSGSTTCLYYTNQISIPSNTYITLSFWIYHDTVFSSGNDRLSGATCDKGTDGSISMESLLGR
ncbi:MAG: hypothetical protein N3B21_01315, partial [Clostridia bacterium]|nr:hypothetical protein [Clostridia bacterium]